MAHGDFDHTQDSVKPAASNGIAPPSFPLPLPDSPDIITANLLLLIGQTSDPRLKLIYQLLVKHLHAFIKESNLSTDEWMAAIQFLTRVGQACTPVRQEMIFLSDVLGVSALVDVLNSPVMGGATENSVLGPFFTEDAEDIENGGSIASDDKGEYMYVEGRILTTEGEPIAGAVINTWEADNNGLYDTQYADRTHPDYRGRLHSAKDGSFGFRAIVPLSYSVPAEGPIGELLISQGRHNMRPAHLHLMVEAPGYHKVITSFYPDDCDYLASDPVFGVKKSLVVKLEQVDDDAEARKRRFQKGGSFKLLKRNIVLLTEEQSRFARQQVVRESETLSLQTKND
ncbi:Intradiol ring-cleavage dioxygenase [Boletus edulis BED1]|uniref:Intradiol ring-cleavage dioxygenase n=1 Tax=Boletus edulis BED1 TaxID=1328754 RepID=A0AAD4BRB4_BOLED|nr:Intradiol ring-cleavage dioxygenase [Boletus edulis BED1]